ncbi:MAG: type II toxin-antitoxin system VapC family toxin [Humibacter sp.]
MRVRAQDARATRPEAGYFEVDITSAHAVAVGELPPIHGDPFDRMLVAQARVEGFTLLTSDKRVAEYGPPSRLV